MFKIIISVFTILKCELLTYEGSKLLPAIVLLLSKVLSSNYSILFKSSKSSKYDIIS